MHPVENRFPYPLSDAYLRKRLAFAIFRPFDVLDTGERPLMEGKSFHHGLGASDLRACPYHDSRRAASADKPMNSGALLRFRQDQAQVAAILAAIVTAAAARGDASTSSSHSLLGLWRVAHAARMLPLVDLLRADHLSQPLPPPMAAIGTVHKFAIGVMDVVGFALKTGHQIEDCRGASELYALADEGGRLIGEKEVCPAPPKYMLEILEMVVAICSGRHRDTVELDSATRESVSRAVSFSLPNWQLHRFALVHDLVRHRTWHLARRASPPLRHASPYGALALAATALPDPLEHPTVGSMLRIHWTSPGEVEINGIFSAWMSLATEILRGGHTMALERLQARRAQLDALSLLFLQEADRKLATAIGLPSTDAPYRYVPRDLEHFFGGAPTAADFVTASLQGANA
ncbi:MULTISPECIES: hypothetical protein [Burkholderia]|uniref:Uncharacterized protein n=1 Tax=Burkholderia gladioli TaxID=28095 RepID=A0A2A7SGC2_BURGA|nr:MULTISPECIES: hypothetical protein [Burkholderia]TWD11932.1 hypothetical protein FB601_101163 [Burkholderia sp. SJZ091]MBU9378498.1 hypothetical protein [Burkholderia gladioli]MDC6131602.1 hypothetical protein [Burkholderia gladioli]PEH42586.1 hypothetical protein CRM94_10720 [Burkholderia gladioli]PEH82698.1 hypothetical protein CRM95_32100 [Burkholderia gladioli]